MSSNELKVEVHAKCDQCGTELEVTYATIQSGYITCDVVECSKCTEKTSGDGYEEGFAAGKAEGAREQSA